MLRLLLEPRAVASLSRQGMCAYSLFLSTLFLSTYFFTMYHKYAMRLLRLPLGRDLRESVVRNSAPLLPSDVFGVTDDDDVMQDFADYLFKTRRSDSLHAILIRAAAKALLSGLVHHALSDTNTVVLSLLSQ